MRGAVKDKDRAFEIRKNMIEDWRYRNMHWKKLTKISLRLKSSALRRYFSSEKCSYSLHFSPASVPNFFTVTTSGGPASPKL